MKVKDLIKSLLDMPQDLEVTTMGLDDLKINSVESVGYPSLFKTVRLYLKEQHENISN